MDSSAPTFDEKALVSLTNRIQKGFRESDSFKRHSAQPKGASDSKTTKGKSGQRSADTKHVVSIKKIPKGKKRDARGELKEHKVPKSDQGRQFKQEKSTSVNISQSNKIAKPPKDNILLQEILALGGTEEDLELIGESESDDNLELEASTVTPKDKSLKNDVARFVAGLGIDPSSLENNETSDDPGSDQELQNASDNNLSHHTVQPTAPVKRKEGVSNSSKESKGLMFEARSDWHAAPLSNIPLSTTGDTRRYKDAIIDLKAYAQSLLEEDNTLYASKNLSSTSSHRFLATIMSSGTLADKVSALTLVVQESPVHTVNSFESLLGLAKKRSRGQAVSALGAIKDLLGPGNLLPSDRRLRTFGSQPGLLGCLQAATSTRWKKGDKLPDHMTKAHLISWVFEDWLKDIYFEMLKVLEGWCNDEVDFARSRAVTYVYELLRDKPEQESNLLRLLVNKIGDPDKKIASRTSYLILQLQITHPLMKMIIIKSIESELLLRPGQGTHAKYYAINTLNQTILSSKEDAVARKLLSIYFDLFVVLLKKPETWKAQAGPKINKKGQVQGGGGKEGKKAKQKAIQRAEAIQATEASTEKVISAILTGVNRAFPFAGSDESMAETHLDTLFKITHSSNFNTSVQALILIQRLASSQQIALDRFYRTLYESMLDPRLITSSKHALYLNMLFRSLVSDLSVKRVKAFVKRLLQILTLHQPPFVCGALFMIRQLEGQFPGLRSLICDPEYHGEGDEEIFRDVPEDGEESNNAPKISDNGLTLGQETNWTAFYDGRRRDPEHSNADRTCAWELLPFTNHFHPSASIFAKRLLESGKMPAKPDLETHSLMHFLDKFVYKNAKAAVAALRGSSIMQPIHGVDNQGALLSNRSKLQGQTPVNSDSFWRLKAEDVAADDVFFHKYFTRVTKPKHNKAETKSSKPPKNMSDEDDNDEDEIWQALVDSRPELEGASDDDSAMLDLDDSAEDESLDGEDDASDVTEDLPEPSDGNIKLDDSDLALDDILVEGSDDDENSDLDELFNKELGNGQQPEIKPDNEVDQRKPKRRKFSSLPTFAAIEDYEEMLQDEEELL